MRFKAQRLKPHGRAVNGTTKSRALLQVQSVRTVTSLGSTYFAASA